MTNCYTAVSVLVYRGHTWCINRTGNHTTTKAAIFGSSPP